MNDGAPSIRSIHMSRQRSPTIAGSGGRAFHMNIEAAHCAMSDETQPPS